MLSVRSSHKVCVCVGVYQCEVILASQCDAYENISISRGRRLSVVSFWYKKVHTRIPSNVDGVIGVTCVGANIWTLRLASLPINHQLHPVANFVGCDRVPPAVTEALAVGRVLCCDASSSIVYMEEQLGGDKDTRHYYNHSVDLHIFSLTGEKTCISAENKSD